MVKKLSKPRLKTSAIQQQQDFAEAVEPLSILDTDIEGATLDQLSEIVSQAHQAVAEHLLSALQAALVGGRALLAAREQFAYDRQTGGFRGWLDNQSISRATAYRYIEMAENIEIVSQAETLSQAKQLIAQLKAEESRPKTQPFVSRRTTLKLTKGREKKLLAAAKREGVEISVLINRIVEEWCDHS